MSSGDMRGVTRDGDGFLARFDHSTHLQVSQSLQQGLHLGACENWNSWVLRRLMVTMTGVIAFG